MLILVGQAGTKRTEYFRRAAESLQVPFLLAEWDDTCEIKEASHHGERRSGRAGSEESDCMEMLQRGGDFPEGAVVKIDPPSYSFYRLDEMERQIKAYQSCLQQFGHAAFLNEPGAILELLDKRSCKKTLEDAHVPVTEMILEKVEDLEQLLARMEERRLNSVFLKPVFFSGAAGVTAFRVQPGRGKMQAYTSCRLVEGQLVNTKTLYCMNDREEIAALLREMLKLDVMVERWVPKSTFQGKSYDLRIVYQFGHIAYIVVRQAKGPVTNLHLNNQALAVGELGLDSQTMEELEGICDRAVAAFPGLSMAGIDVLLEKNSKKPYIIEMNGQGDLIYQDIFSDNRIYKEQVRNCLKITGTS